MRLAPFDVVTSTKLSLHTSVESSIFLKWYQYRQNDYALTSHKKVLLRERKRHAARRVASACYAALSNGGVPHPVIGGVPHPVMGGTPHHPDLTRGVPHPVMVGVPRGTPTIQTWLGGYLGIPPP